MVPLQPPTAANSRSPGSRDLILTPLACTPFFLSPLPLPFFPLVILVHRPRSVPGSKPGKGKKREKNKKDVAVRYRTRTLEEEKNRAVPTLTAPLLQKII